MEHHANIKFATNWGKLQRRCMKCWCRCTVGKPWAENVFTNGSYAFTKRRKMTWGWAVFGQPSTSRTLEIEKVWQMLAQDWWLILRLIVEELGISKDTAHTIICHDLGKQKICSRFVPHKLTGKQKTKQIETSADSFPCVTRIHCFWKTGSRIKTAIDFPVTKKESLQKSKVKALLIAFFDNKGIIHKEFVPAAQAVNAAFYHEVLNRLLQYIRRVWPELHRTGKWMLLHDNAPAHSAIHMRQFLAQKMVALLDHPPYSPDLARADFFLFPRLKAAIKCACFVDVNAIKDRVTAVLQLIPQEVFADCFWKLYESCQTCAVADGDYFEGQ